MDTVGMKWVRLPRILGGWYSVGGLGSGRLGKVECWFEVACWL